MAIRRTMGQRPSVKSAAEVKAKTLGGALPSGPARSAPQLAALSAEQVVAEVKRRQIVEIGNTYAMALCLRELSRPERYRDELGFASFDALLAAHRELPSRMTCFKWITVVNTFTEEDVRKLGGMEKAYQVVRTVHHTNPQSDPRQLLKKDAQVLGVKVEEVSARRLRDLLSAHLRKTRKVSTEAAKKVARRVRVAFKKLVVAARLRVHTHDGAACVETHFPVKGAETLLAALKGTLPSPAT